MISNITKFCSYLIVLIPSLICSLFVLYCFLVDRTLRTALHNHVFIIMLIIDLICLVTMFPWMLYYYHYDGVWQRSLIFCEIWDFIDFGFYVTHTTLFAWATIERHILIFHDQWMVTKKKRFLIHYLPIISILLYCLIFQTIMDFSPPCQNTLNNLSMYCAGICMKSIYVDRMYMTIAHEILPVMIIVVSSIALLLRAVWTRHRTNQPIQWRRYRKMTMQLSCISLFFILFYLPLALCIIIDLYGVSNEIFIVAIDFFFYSSYFVPTLFSFVCILSLPELRGRFLRLLHLQRPVRRIVPEILPIRANVNRDTLDQ